MEILQGFKFEIMPDGAQVRAAWQFAGNRRKIWNLALAKQMEIRKEGGKHQSAFSMNDWLTDWKEQAEFEYLNLSPSQTLQQATKDLAAAYEKFFKKTASFPQFKKKGKCAESFRFPQGFKIEEQNNRMFLPKLGWVRYRQSRAIIGTPKNITVSHHAGKWFASVQTLRSKEQPLPQSSSMIGIDKGITRFATLSDGRFIAPLNRFKKHEVRLARYQRAMSRKQKFSKNWIKAKAKITTLHSRIGNVRGDFLHKTTTTLSKNHAMIVVEDLKVTNMSASAKGTLAEPGRKVAQKSGLNKAILDQGWGMFDEFLDYKLQWNGGELLEVPPHHTSQTCPACGHVSADNRQTQAKFEWVECGYSNNADVVGAINILNKGRKKLEGQDTVDSSTGCESIAQLVCVSTGGCSATQKPRRAAPVRGRVNGAVMPSATETRRGGKSKPSLTASP